jgi:hypothetical protein
VRRGKVRSGALRKRQAKRTNAAAELKLRGYGLV